jgi:hypothetical protein
VLLELRARVTLVVIYTLYPVMPQQAVVVVKALLDQTETLAQVATAEQALPAFRLTPQLQGRALAEVTLVGVAVARSQTSIAQTVELPFTVEELAALEVELVALKTLLTELLTPAVVAVVAVVMLLRLFLNLELVARE